MRRWPTWLLVGALGALGAIATADALRGSTNEVSVEAPRRQVASSPVLRLREPNGVLYYSDADDGCRLHGVGLPRLENAPPPQLQSCAFSLSPDGTAALAGNVSWSPRGGLYARESDRMIELGSPASDERLRFPGRAPAFMLDGTFTYVTGRNEVVAWTTDCPPGARLFTLPADNATARCRLTLMRISEEPVLALAWLSSVRIAVITAPSEHVLTIREGKRILLDSFGFGQPLSDLRVSPRRHFVSVRAPGRGGLLVFHSDGSSASLPPLTDAHSIAWSPDDRWTAVATQNSVFLFRTDEPEPRVRRLAITARDLAWR